MAKSLWQVMWIVLQAIRQMPGVFQRLAGALAGGGQWRMRRVTDCNQVVFVPSADRVMIVYVNLVDTIGGCLVYDLANRLRPIGKNIQQFARS